jgi:hypothetical protein
MNWTAISDCIPAPRGAVGRDLMWFTISFIVYRVFQLPSPLLTTHKKGAVGVAVLM